MDKIRVITEETEFLALGKDWNRLLEATENTNIFLTFDWLATWWKHFKNKSQLHIITVERKGELIGAAPLMICRGVFGRTLRFLGRPGSDYSEFVVADGEGKCIQQITHTLFANREWEWVDLSGISEDSPSFKILSESWEDHLFLTMRIFLGPAPYLPIETTWDDYQKGLPKKFRNDTTRQMKRLRETGIPRFEQCLNGKDATGLVEELIRQKRWRYRQTGARDIFSDRRWIAFYHEVAEKFLRKGWLQLSRLRLNGTDLALHLGFVYQKRFFFYIPSFNPEFKKFSVGRILLSRLLERAHLEGLNEFDFLAGDEPYKYGWANRARKLYRFSAYRKNPRGLLLLQFYEHILPSLRTIWRLRRSLIKQRKRDF